MSNTLTADAAIAGSDSPQQQEPGRTPRPRDPAATERAPRLLSSRPASEETAALSLPERWTLEDLRREYILEIMRQSRGRNGEAARILGIDRRTLASRLRRYLAD